MSRVLVCGGCGFIGSNFIRYLLETYCDVRVVNLDKLTYAGNLQNLADVASDRRYNFMLGDITDIEKVRLAMNNADVVFNFAAESHVDRSIDDASQFLHTNVLGTQVLLDVARQYQVKRFIQVSTDEVYGSCKEGSFTEESPLQPNNPYAASKAAADLLARSYYKTYGTHVIVTRCSNNYGPYQFPEKLIPLFIANLLDGDACPIYGDGKQVRDWIHVRDHCSAIDYVSKMGTVGEVYNIGARCEKTNLQIAYGLIDRLGYNSTSSLKHVKDRPGHDRRYSIDPGKLEKLGWQPQITFDEGLTDTVEWYKKNREWVNNVRNGDYMDYYKKHYADRPVDNTPIADVL